MTKYFIDTEFIENGSTIELISIGIVREDGTEFYAQKWNDPDKWYRRNWAEPTDWIVRNVFPHLDHFDMSRFGRNCEPATGGAGSSYSSRCKDSSCPWRKGRDLRDEIIKFCSGEPEFWGYYCDYDWVALCQIFGTMMKLPQGWPMYCHDLRQALDAAGRKELKQPDDDRHHALDDARWIRGMVMGGQL